MATTAKRRMEERRCRLPNDQAIWHRAEKQDEPAPEIDPSELPADQPTA
jgi:hypothetical protein